MATPKSEHQIGPGEAPALSPSRFPFVGRSRELTRLCELAAQRSHVLLLGPAGVGKSALVGQLRQQLSLLVSAKSAHLGAICEDVELQLALEPAGRKLFQRKQRLREALAAAGRTIVFDGVGWISPKLSSFFESVTERAPVWICTRSEHPWDIGHFWPLLVRFERVELRPFHLSETQALVEAAVQARLIPPETRSIVEWLHRRSGGSPLVLRELFEELATGKYDLNSPLALRRLDLDRRIHEVFPGSGPGAAESRGKSL
ncbi:MAG: AAA family ATPase [Limisphaerales bacterium]